MRRPRLDGWCAAGALAVLVPFLVVAHAYASIGSERDSLSRGSVGYRPLPGTANEDETVRVRAQNCTDPSGNTSVQFSPDLTPAELAGTAAAMDWWDGCTRGQGQPQTTAVPGSYSHGQRHLLTGSQTGATCTSEERGCKRPRHGGLLHQASSKRKPKPGAAAAMVVDPAPPAGMPSYATPSAPADGEAATEAVPEVDMAQHALASSENNSAWCSDIYGAYLEAPHLTSLNTKAANGIYKELVVLTADHLKKEAIVAARAALGERLCAIVPADDASAATLDRYNLGRATADAANGSTARLRTIAIRPGAGLMEDTLSMAIVMTCGTRPEPCTG